MGGRTWAKVWEVLLSLLAGLLFVLIGLGGERYFLLVAICIAPLLTALLADALAWDEEKGESLVSPVYVIGFLTTAPVRGMGSRLRTGQPKTYPLVRRGVQTGRPNWVARGLLLLLIVVYGYIIWGCFWGGETTVIDLPTRAGF